MTEQYKRRRHVCGGFVRINSFNRCHE